LLNVNCLHVFSGFLKRKTTGVVVYNNGVQPLVVQKILGHKDLKTTMEIYTQVYAGRMQEAVSFLDNLT